MKEAARLTDDFFRRMQAANRLPAAGEAFVGLAIGQAIIGRTEVARAGLARAQAHNLITDGIADEMVGLGAILQDARLAKTYLDRAVEYVRKASLPENADASERSVRAIEALASGRNQEAYDLAVSAGNDPNGHNAAFVAGLSALRLKRWDDGVTAFNAVLTHRNRLGLSPLVGVCYVMLGRAHAGAGRVGEARKAFDEAFKIWKDADADMPLLIEARKEYERLGS